MSYDPDLVAQSNTFLWARPVVKGEAHAPRQASQILTIVFEIIPLGKEGSFFFSGIRNSCKNTDHLGLSYFCPLSSLSWVSLTGTHKNPA